MGKATYGYQKAVWKKWKCGIQSTFLAMIKFCLTLLMKNKIGYKGTLLEMLNWVRDYWTKPMPTFISEVFKEPERTSKGRRRPEYERIFQEILAQYESGDVSHLDDLIYDPIFK